MPPPINPNSSATNPAAAAVPPVATQSLTPVEAALSTLAHQLKAQSNELIGLISCPRHSSAILAQAADASDQAMSALRTALPHLSEEILSNLESPIQMTMQERRSALEVVSTALSLNPKNMDAWFSSLRLFENDAQQITVIYKGTENSINRVNANRILLSDITGDRTIGQPSNRNQ